MTKILLIEDEIMLAEMYRDKFKQAGFEMILAFSVAEGLRFIKKEKPDLVLLDIVLPEESGINFLKKIKTIPDFAEIPIVAFSNYDDPRAKKEAFQLGAQDYLIKTAYTPKEIIAKIKEYLGD